jgi:RNA recognition motif-containing protein
VPGGVGVPFVRDLVVGRSGLDFGDCRVRVAQRLGRGEEEALSKKLYVGNLPWSTTEAELKDLFEQHGTVTSVSVITDRETGRSRGFAFVEMDPADADTAMQALDGKDMDGRALRVNEAHERRGGGGGGGGGYRGGGGGGGRGRY